MALNWSQTVAMYLSTHLAEVPLLGASALLNVGSKSQPGALAGIQTLDNVDCTPSHWIMWHCRHALFQPDVLASQPFCLLPASQSFCTVGLMRPLHQPICFRVVRHGLQLLHAKEFTHLINDAAHKAPNHLGVWLGPQRLRCTADAGTC